MQITLEAAAVHSIQAYSEHAIKINSIHYQQSLIVSREEIISDLAIKKIQDMDATYLDLLMRSQPEVILIGHTQLGVLPSQDILDTLRKKGCGMECMSIGAACRTFNILLSENRSVVMGILLKSCYWTSDKLGSNTSLSESD